MHGRPDRASAHRPRALRADIQGLRAIAVAAVVAYHAGGWVPGGYLGVDLFFVVSGYVITRSIALEVRRTGRFDVRAFVVRRVLRLAPVAAVVTATTLAAALFVLPVALLDEALRAAFAAATLWANVFFYGQGGYFDAASELNPFLHTWSLSVEEQFYLAWPLVVLAALAWGRRVAARADGAARAEGRPPAGGVARAERAWRGAAALLAAASLVGFVGWSQGWLPLPLAQDADRFVFFAPVTRAWEFLAGALVYLVPGRGAARGPAWARPAAGWLGLAALAVAFALPAADGADLSVPAVLLTVAAAAWLLRLGHAPEDGTSATPAPDVALGAYGRVLGSHALGWVGDRSYGLYLWHWPPIAFLHARAVDAPGAMALAIASAMALAALSYRGVEQPFRAGAWRRPSVAVAVACTHVLLGSAAAVGGALVLRDGGALASAAGARVRAAEAVPFGRATGCHDARAEAWAIDPACRLEGAAPTVWLVGDSHADAVSDVLVDLTRAAGVGLVVTTKSGCAFADVGRADGRDDGTCEARNEDLLARLVAEGPSAVAVIANREFNFARDRNGVDGGMRLTRVDPATGDVRTGRTQVYVDGLVATVRALREAGVGVVYVLNVPEQLASTPECRALLGPPCAPTFAAAETDALRAQVSTPVREALAAVPGVVVVDPYDLFCADGRCAAGDADALWFRDDDHLSVAGAARLGPRLGAAVGVWVGAGGRP